MLKKAITIILALAMMSGTSVFASNETEESNNATQIEQNSDTNGNDKITVLYSAKIVSGKGDYIFSPNDKLTREEAATILCRAANYLDIELPLAKVDMSYADNSEISSWAVSSVYSLKTLNILNNTDKNFNPKANITISQAVSALVRLS